MARHTDSVLLPVFLDGQWRITLPQALCRQLGWDTGCTLLTVREPHAGAFLVLPPTACLLLIEPTVFQRAVQDAQETLDQE